MLLAHAPIAYMVNEVIQRKGISKLRRRDQLMVAFFSLFFGILPDFDFFILLNASTPPFQHHLYYFHSLIFWVPVWILVYFGLPILGRLLEVRERKIFTKEFLQILAITFIIATASHLLADVLVGYNAILFPVTQQFTVLGKIFPINYFRGYLFSVQFAIELIILVVFLVLIVKRFLRKEKLSRYLGYIFIPMTVLYLGFSVFISLNTYNYSIPMADGHTDYDRDADGVHDARDLDTDNDGRNNIEDLDVSLLKEDAKEILEEGVYTDNVFGLWYFGGLNSYRLISQSAFNQNRAFEPVLSNYYREREGVDKYSLDFSYEQYLYYYLEEKGLYGNGDLLDSDMFFVLDQESNVINMGVVIDRDSIGIVMPKDKRTTIHNPRYVMDYYEGKDLFLVKY